MKLTSAMVVPESTPDDDAQIRNCPECGTRTWFTPQKVMVMSAGGARSMRLWSCEQHRLRDHITDDPNSDV